ncbi:RHS repeat-associated core domain-containing protein [Marinobacter sp. es.042]|uniref:RHS repeat-associated core domain-containing protein n=1 Tax=Marinobacter sp. es.042 TaxID=1761794 RepID=UPI000B5EDDE4|nr:RHS repeat-associated core domain-containing protein [Marinobacter sp. es.042]SNB56925.1 RHS repeat-associated core domain-containing protein [Marinobacter sp. es.042]
MTEVMSIKNSLRFAFLFLLSAVVQAMPGIETIQQSPASKRIGLDAHYVDLRIASFGDDLAISREWIDGKWTWNKQWQSVISRPPATGTGEDGPWYVLHGEVERFKAVFDQQVGSSAEGQTLISGNEALGERVELSESAIVWRDAAGNWVRYVPETPAQTGVNGGAAVRGHIDAYGNALYQNTIIRDAQNRPSQIQDHFGNLLLTITYDGTSNRPATVTDYTGRSVTYTYNTDSQLVTVNDVRGQDWQYTYTAKGKLKTIADPNGNVTQYAYDQNSVTETTADQLQTVYQYQYDKAKDQFRRTITGPDGSVREALYDNSPNPGTDSLRYQQTINGELTSKRLGTELDYRTINAAGDEIRYEKNALGKLETVTHPDGTTETWEYSADGRFNTAYVDQLGARTEWDYDSKGRVTEIRQAVGTPEQQTVRYSYPDLLTRITTWVGDANTGDAFTTERFDQYGNVSSFTDAENNTAAYTHNVLGQVLTETTAKGVLESYTYDAAGNLTEQVDGIGRITKHAYDAAGNKKTTTWPNLAVTTFSYNALNEQVAVTNAKNETVATEYDRETRTFVFKDAKNATTEVTMNAKGLPKQITDPNGNTTVQNYQAGRLASTQYPTFEQTFEYTSGSRLKSITDQYDGKQSKTQLTVDPLGQITQQTDANSNTEQRTYDGLGRLTEITDAIGGITRLAYDSHGNLIKVTDPEGRETRFEYNGNNQVLAEERSREPGHVSRRTYSYDANGNLKTEITPNGEKVVYSYNDADELTGIEFFDTVNDSVPAKLVNLGYNDLGQLTSYDDGETSGSYTYDEVGQLKTASTDFGPFTKNISYTYDAAGNIATYTNPEGITYAYTYDANGQVKSVEIPGVGLVSFSNYEWTQPTQINLPGGSVIQRQYDGLQRMESNTLLDPAQSALMSVLYGYDPVGNILSQTGEDGDTLYGYDDLYRLTSADYPVANDESFDYDGVGNRTSHNGDTSWQYNSANQLTGQSDTTYQYNANGHMTQKTVSGETTYYFYNNQERLVRVEDTNNQVIARYGYNPFGHRLWKEVGGVKTYFFYNQSGLVGEYSSTGELIKEYQYTANSTWMTNPLFQRDGGQVYFYQNSHLGTPQRMLATSGEVVWAVTYTAFGDAKPSIIAVKNNLRLPGQYFDQETGLHHNYFRDYDPELGRYIQSDPLGLTSDINYYTYSRSNPLRFFDPLGLLSNEKCEHFLVDQHKSRFRREKREILSQYTKYEIFMAGPSMGLDIEDPWNKPKLKIGFGVSFEVWKVKYTNLHIFVYEVFERLYDYKAYCEAEKQLECGKVEKIYWSYDYTENYETEELVDNYYDSIRVPIYKLGEF